MGRTVPTSNQENTELIDELRRIRDGLTTKDKKIWDIFVKTGHLNERAISLAVFVDPLESLMLAMLFKQFKMILKLGGELSDWQADLDSQPEESKP